MRIKAIILLCCLFISGCTSFGKETNTYVVANNNRGYITNCNKLFHVLFLFNVVPLFSIDSDSCNTIYIKDDKFSILHNGKLHEPIKKFYPSKEEYYIIRIDVNKLKKDKEAKVVYENNKTEAFKLYEEYVWGYETSQKRVLTPTRKYFPSE